LEREQPSPAELIPSPQQRPLEFLREVPPHEAARVLSREQAQTVALVVTRLDADLAGQLLGHLPPELATDVLERMAWLQEPAAEVLVEIERHLRNELARCGAAEGASSLANLQSLLQAMEPAARSRLLADLRKRDAGLARRLGYQPPIPPPENYTVTALRYRIDRKSHLDQVGSYGVASADGCRPAPLIEFDDFLNLSDDSLRRIFSAADSQVALLALTGASEPLLARIAGQLPSREAATLRTRLNHPGAVRLSDITAAQEQLAELARRLAQAGAIVLPGSRHFAAAA
jgi:flagellar motor switch protein FliG